LEEERNTLLQEKEQLMKQRNELAELLERMAVTGDYSAMDTEVLPFR
jgi:seryl-tRNA synthetase